jgi:NADH-quinone oxidoreductase subunit F
LAAVAAQAAQPHYLVCYADESEPGTFKDRVLMEHDPFAVVEAMAIEAFAVGASKAYLYIRGEYPLA